jgi:hypothetical protein
VGRQGRKASSEAVPVVPGADEDANLGFVEKESTQSRQGAKKKRHNPPFSLLGALALISFD